MVKTWHLSDSRLALLTNNPHVETAAQQAGLSHMADYAKDGKLLTVQYAGPEEAVKVVAACEVVDAITHNRGYRSALPLEAALAKIWKWAPPEMVEAVKRALGVRKAEVSRA